MLPITMVSSKNKHVNKEINERISGANNEDDYSNRVLWERVTEVVIWKGFFEEGTFKQT